MKIAVTSTGESASSPIDQRFGRAQVFLVHDLETEVWTAVHNRQERGTGRAGQGPAHGAGVQAAQRIVDLGVGAVITGACGPKASAVLESAGVIVHTGVTGTALEALASYKSGTLVPASGDSAQCNQQTM